ncbi:DUF2461 domain-containing protein [uncultured Ruegeria sp.]|uniref:DUF2461 domain-containing protein n=1 Tax=uncultured Ruegeria sp. TaxID=259304 RepID=UPI002636467C|nr:DUF2461 domain-containing protein [uncultured Ruegeria sp.]
MAQFDCFSPEAVGFLQDLKANNTKDWFAANKATYETHLKAPSKQFADDMALALGDLTGQNHGSKIFRIYRDVRFSKDKTPYNAHLHLAFMSAGPAVQPPMWFFALSPEKLSLGCGVFHYDKGALDVFRDAMAGPLGAELIQTTTEMRGRGFRISDPELKRVPSGFDKDHPHEDALRRKGFSVWIDAESPAFVLEPNLTKRTTTMFAELMPVFLLLSRIK